MVSDEIGMKLHDRATTGEALSPAEQAQLKAWYAAKDQAEAAMFRPISIPLADLTTLQTQIDQTLAELAGIQHGLDDFEQGQFSSMEDFVAEQNQKYGLSLEA